MWQKGRFSPVAICGLRLCMDFSLSSLPLPSVAGAAGMSWLGRRPNALANHRDGAEITTSRRKQVAYGHKNRKI